MRYNDWYHNIKYSLAQCSIQIIAMRQRKTENNLCGFLQSVSCTCHTRG